MFYNDNYGYQKYNDYFLTLEEFDKNIEFIQTKINENFTKWSIDEGCVTTLLKVITNDIVQNNIRIDKNDNKSNILSEANFYLMKNKFKQFNFQCAEVNEYYLEAKKDFANIYNDDPHGIKAEFLICKKLLILEFNDPNYYCQTIIAHCKFLNKLFKNGYDEKLLKSLRKLEEQLSNIDK